MGAWPRQCGFIFYLFPLVPLGFGEVDFGGFLVGLFGVVLAWGWELLGPVGGCQHFIWMVLQLVRDLKEKVGVDLNLEVKELIIIILTT